MKLNSEIFCDVCGKQIYYGCIVIKGKKYTRLIFQDIDGEYQAMLKKKFHLCLDCLEDFKNFRRVYNELGM